MRNYIFKKDIQTVSYRASNLSEAYGLLRNQFGSDTGWEWTGTNA